MSLSECSDTKLEVWRTDKYVSVKIQRSGFLDCHTTVKWACVGADEKFEGDLTFTQDQMRQVVTFQLAQVPRVADCEEFEFKLVAVQGDFEPKLGNGTNVTVHNNVPGAKFHLASERIAAKQSDYSFTITVKRTNYLDGACTCMLYLTDSHPGYSLLAQNQSRGNEINFESGQDSANIEIQLNEYPIDPLPSQTDNLSNEHLDSHEIFVHLASVQGAGCPAIVSPDRGTVDIDHDIGEFASSERIDTLD